MPAGATPGLDTVTLIETGRPPAFTFPKFREAGFTATSVPIPVRATVLRPAVPKFSAIEPVRLPPAEGANATFSVHTWPPVSADGQLLVCTKSPDAEMPALASGAEPMLVTV